MRSSYENWAALRKPNRWKLAREAFAQKKLAETTLVPVVAAKSIKSVTVPDARTSSRPEISSFVPSYVTNKDDEATATRGNPITAARYGQPHAQSAAVRFGGLGRRYVLVAFDDRPVGLLSHADGSGLLPEARPKLTALSWQEIRLALQFSPEQFLVRTERYKDFYDFRRRRAELEGEWFLLRKGETVMGLALSKNPKLSFGTSSVGHFASSHEGLQILTARLNQALPAFLPDYAPLRWRKFRFLSRKTELVSKITKEWEVDPLVTQFSITPRTDLEARIVELTEGKVEAAVVASIGMRWNVEAPLEKLSAIGIPLEGL